MPNTLTTTFAATVLSCALATSAHAVLKISSSRTKGVTCSNGICTPTTSNANLNAGDLQTMLAASDVTVKSNAAAVDIGIVAPLTWASTHHLTLDAYESIHIRAPIVVEGTAGIALITSDGGGSGAYSFNTGTSGSITFWDTASALIINGQSYKLEKDIGSLALDAQQFPDGNYALAASYDASADGVYISSPIPFFQGNFEGLGNAIQNLTIKTQNAPVGLFGRLLGSYVGNLTLENETLDTNGDTGGLTPDNADHSLVSSVTVTGSARGGCAGGLIGHNEGTILNSGSSVSVQGSNFTGGLVCENEGLIGVSFATGQVVGAAQTGGLIGANRGGSVYQSFAAGSVRTKSDAGGLIGIARNHGGLRSSPTVSDCYSTATVTSVKKNAGGLIGNIDTRLLTTKNSFATGMISAPANGKAGGAIGLDHLRNNLGVYWDLDTTGISNPHQGAGDPLDDPGITGLTDAQLKSALPAGFDPNVWGQSASINNGWPYLLANPPPQ